ncbi:MAG TPA: hypothetical protein VGO91_13515 [Pyrinomonadaceae bacterium]|jgi:hypothetical protein|nr:hypothetical protein [Pyrinomonadaceae bacterium]
MMRTGKHKEASPRTSRRQFAKNVSAAILSAPLAASLAQAQAPAKSKEAPAPPNPQQGQTPPKPSPVAEAYADVAHARFGDKVTPEQMEQIKKKLEGKVDAADRLRKVKLKNEDEPDFIFNA